MKRRFTAERRDQLANMIIAERHVSVSEASERLKVSTETIRKDLLFLENQGLIVKSRGGAMPAESSMEVPIIQKQAKNVEQKNRITQEAIRLVQPNSSILLDSGTTTLALARLLARKSDLTIFTNSSAALGILAESNNTVFIFGGRVRGSSLAVVGSWANEQLLSINADIAFLGTDGFQGLSGPATSSYDESEIKRNMIRVSNRRVILADGSKFTTKTPFEFATWSQIDTLITNTCVEDESIKEIEEQTQVIYS